MANDGGKMNTAHMRRIAKDLRFAPGAQPTEVVAEVLDEAASVIDRLQHGERLIARTERGEVWHWQGDGHDYPDSIGCPVVIDENDLRELIHKADRYTWLEANAKEVYLRPDMVSCEWAPDIRTKWETPTLICSGPVGGMVSFGESIDNKLRQRGLF